MKKNVISLLIIFCCLCFSAYTGDADVHAIDSDCEYLKTIIEEASIDISKTIDEGLDSSKLIEDIKNEYALLSYLDYGSVYINTLTTRTVNALKGRGAEDGNQYLLGKSTEKYILMNEDYKDNFIRQMTPEYKGKILLVTDWGTASAAETFIGILKILFNDKVIIAGQNTLGCLDYGNVHDFLLRNSRLKISLCQTDHTQTIMFNSNINWHGDGRGFYPDLWYRLDDDLDVQELISLIR